VIVYRVGDGFQDAWGREVTEDGRLLSEDMPPPVNQAALEALAAPKVEVEEPAEEEQPLVIPPKPSKKGKK